MGDPAELERKAEEVAGLLSAISNPRRLIILCKLAQAGEMTVSGLLQGLGLSQSALSQHLAVMRGEGLLGTRKEGLNVYYRIADPRAFDLMNSLERIFCPAEETT
jgi:ArsR family transcriptional regulator, virulence genes transcriptional regulator